MIRIPDPVLLNDLNDCIGDYTLYLLEIITIQELGIGFLTSISWNAVSGFEHCSIVDTDKLVIGQSCSIPCFGDLSIYCQMIPIYC